MERMVIATAGRVAVFLLAGFLATPLTAQIDEDVLKEKTVEQILVHGLVKVQESTVLRQMKSKAGEPYSPSNLVEDRQRLDRMALFTKIAIEAQAGAAGVILQVELKETLPYFPYPSVSLTSEQGVTAGGGLKSTNFLGTGTNLATAARFGGATEFEIIASSPWRGAGSWWWTADYFLKDRTNRYYDDREFSNEVDLQAGRQVTDKLRIGGRFHFLSLKSDVSGITLSPTNQDITPGLGVVVEYDSRDSWTNPKRGWWNSVDATANGLGADGNYRTFNFDVRRYQPISGRHNLAIFSLLTLQTGIVGKDIPVHEVFHIGGANSLRGWEINARQGKNQWLNSVEYRYDLVKVRDRTFKGVNFYAGMQLAAFVDSGSAWNDSDQFSKNFIGGAGFGIRLLIPYVSMVRLDVGFGQPGHILIPDFGVMEKPVYQRRRVR
jgi:outer membrane protein assembly factor BamA